MAHSGPIRQSDIVFLGDSLTESFRLKYHFNRDDLRNRGISGDTTGGVIYRLGEITRAKPRKLFLMIGINDVYQGFSPGQVSSNIEKILQVLMDETPATIIFLQSILPVNEDRLLIDESVNTRIYELNYELEKLCSARKINWIDLHSEFLNQRGQMDSKFTYDGLHLTPEGYIHWAGILLKYL